MQAYDDGFGGFAAYSAAESPAGSPAGSPGFDLINRSLNHFQGCGRAGGLGTSGPADGCCCEGGDGKDVFDGLHVDQSEGSQGAGGGGAGGGPTGEDGDGGSGGDGDAISGGDSDANADAAAAAAADADADADADANADGDADTEGGADAIDGLRLAGGGGIAAPVTLDLDEAAAEGRLGVLQWARRATMEAAPSASSATDCGSGSGDRSRKGGRCCGLLCRGCHCGRHGSPSALWNGGADEGAKGETKEEEEEEETEGAEEEKEEEEKKAEGAEEVVPLRCWGQDHDGDSQRDQERKEEEEEAGEGLEGGTSRLEEGVFPPPGSCSDRCHCPCRCSRGRHQRHGSGSVSLPSTAAVPTAIAATAVRTAPVSPSRDSAPSAPTADIVVGGDDDGCSDGAATFGVTSSVAAAAAAVDSPAAPSDVPGTTASSPLAPDGGDPSPDTAGCRGSRRRRCCPCERRAAAASQGTTDSNGWRHHGACRVVEDTTPVVFRRRRQGVTGRKTGEDVGAAERGIDGAAPPLSLGAGIKRFRVAFSKAAVDGAAGNGHLEVMFPTVDGGRARVLFGLNTTLNALKRYRSGA